MSEYRARQQYIKWSNRLFYLALAFLGIMVGLLCVASWAP